MARDKVVMNFYLGRMLFFSVTKAMYIKLLKQYSNNRHMVQQYIIRQLNTLLRASGNNMKVVLHSDIDDASTEEVTDCDAEEVKSLKEKSKLRRSHTI